MNYLRLEFTATKCVTWPRLKFFVDDDLYQEFKFENAQGTIVIPLELMDGEHVLEVELYGKMPFNTKIFDGKIIEDQLVTLEKMFIDEVELPTTFLFHGRLKNNPETPSLTWGKNDTWIWIFKSPIIKWALDLYRKNDNVQDTMTPVFSEEKNKKLLSILDEIEKELEDVKI